MFVGKDTIPEILKIKSDLIIDAIDSLKDKLELILRCTQKGQENGS